jgi:hypothetical protein
MRDGTLLQADNHPPYQHGNVVYVGNMENIIGVAAYGNWNSMPCYTPKQKFDNTR